MLPFLLVSLFFQCIPSIHADHFKGGSITWKPLFPTSLTSPVQLTITVRHSWTLARYPCNETIKNAPGAYNDTQNSTAVTISCISSAAACAASGFQTISLPFYCVDYSSRYDISTGSFITQQNLTLNSTIEIASRGSSWAVETFTDTWSIISSINLVPVNNKINTPPVMGSLPVVQMNVGDLSAIQILVADWDPEQTVRCRWSYQTPSDECGSACYALPGASVSSEDCSITWTAVLRTEDIANGLTTSTYVISVTAEDFENATSSTPLSSTTQQMMVYVYTPPSTACSPGRPALYSTPRRNQACYAIGTSGNFSFTVYARIYCLNDTIDEFVTSLPLFVQKSNITQLSNYTFSVTFTWSVVPDQTGIQIFCAAAIDNHGVSSTPYCMSYVVGGSNTGFFVPTFVQSTASPVGTVLSTQTRFSIQANMPLKRTTKNNTLITIVPWAGSGSSYSIDCKYSPDVYYINSTLIFYVANPSWVLGTTYAVTMSEGVATGDQYCGTESGSYGSGYWRFTIWNPLHSSTTTLSTSTTTVTIGTVTTRSIGTTTGNTLSTTTGVPLIITVTTTTSTSTSATTATTTTSTSATTATTSTTTTSIYIPDAVVIYPKDLEQLCLQPVTIATALVTITMIPLHLYAMINLFVKMNTHFQKQTAKVRQTRRMRLAKLNNPDEQETLV